MAETLGLAHTTFRREIRRGLLTQPNIRRDREVFEYSAFKAQDSIARGAANKGPPMRMTNLIAQKLKTKIKDERKSRPRTAQSSSPRGKPTSHRSGRYTTT